MTIVITDTTTIPELREAIGHLVEDSRKVEKLIDLASSDKAAHVYRTRWDRIAERIEVLCDELRARQGDIEAT